MKGRIWFSALMAIVGASLLVAASASGGTTASSAASQSTAHRREARSGSSTRVTSITSIRRLPTSAHSWNWMGATQLRMY